MNLRSMNLHFLQRDLSLKPLVCHAVKEAQSRVPGGTPEVWEQFSSRQWRARLRLTRLLAFYHEHPCTMPRTHLLAACAIVLGRFCGHSAAFDEIGEALMPVTALNQP